MARILVVEDERKVLRGLEEGLRAEGYEVAGVSAGEKALALAASQPFDCLVLDRMLPDCDGLAVLAGQVSSHRSRRADPGRRRRLPDAHSRADD